MLVLIIEMLACHEVHAPADGTYFTFLGWKYYILEAQIHMNIQKSSPTCVDCNVFFFFHHLCIYITSHMTQCFTKHAPIKKKKKTNNSVP